MLYSQLYKAADDILTFPSTPQDNMQTAKSWWEGRLQHLVGVIGGRGAAFQVGHLRVVLRNDQRPLKLTPPQQHTPQHQKLLHRALVTML